MQVNVSNHSDQSENLFPDLENSQSWFSERFRTCVGNPASEAPGFRFRSPWTLWSVNCRHHSSVRRPSVCLCEACHKLQGWSKKAELRREHLLSRRVERKKKKKTHNKTKERRGWYCFKWARRRADSLWFFFLSTRIHIRKERRVKVWLLVRY